MLAICGGLMRTGSTNMYQVMREIVVSTNRGYAPTMPLYKEGEYFDQHATEWAYEPAIIVAKLHRWRESLEGLQGMMRLVMTIRDMRDVVVSLMNFREATFESSINSNAFKGNIAGQEEWEAKMPARDLFKVRYEDFIYHRMETTQAVAAFLGIRLKDYEALGIEQKYNINANKRRAERHYPLGHPEYMAERHIRSGKVGQWREALTDEQVYAIQDKTGHQWFNDNGYKLVD